MDTDDILGISKLPVHYTQYKNLDDNHLKSVLKAMKQIRMTDKKERASYIKSILPPLSMPGSLNWPIYNNNHIDFSFIPKTQL
mmetsp:Transcript_18891/g.3050  ORF Transcript_18891/g.3050 Transcript_18891/m.3050 type:complete len:83 (+) Transcript_18891:125-373(+)